MPRSFSDLTFSWRSGWFTRTSTRTQGDDTRFSDEDILTILHAGEAGLKVEALCVAGGIPVETYYVWKAKYTGLSPLDLRARREDERRKARRLKVAAAVLPTALVAVAVLYALVRTSATSASAFPATKAVTPRPAAATATAAARASQAPPKAPAKPSVTPRPENPAAPADATSTPRPAARTVPASPRATRPAPGPSRQRPSVDAADIATADPNGPSVQVAAVPTLEDARVTLERLAALGYPAHMTTKVVNQTEMYRVRVGPLKSRAIAEEVARTLERDGFPSPWITK